MWQLAIRESLTPARLWPSSQVPHLYCLHNAQHIGWFLYMFGPTGTYRISHTVAYACVGVCGLLDAK